jgi:hypothetical protein
MRLTIGTLRRVWIPTIAAASVLLGAAQAAPAATYAEGRSGVADICRSVMGTSSGTSQQGACMDALSHSVRRLSDAGTHADARRACESTGLRADDPAFDRCIVQRIHGARGDGPPTRIQATSGRAAGPYSHASPSEIRYRERLACASLGLDPDTQAYASCVANLDSAMFEADHPTN